MIEYIIKSIQICFLYQYKFEKRTETEMKIKKCSLKENTKKCNAYKCIIIIRLNGKNRVYMCTVYENKKPKKKKKSNK